MNEDLKTIENYSQVCMRLRTRELTLDDFFFIEDQTQKIKMLAFHKIQNIIKLFNGDWIINWKNSSQRKWHPYFSVSGSGGLVFSCSYCFSSGFFVEVGFYKDEEISNFCGKLFIDIYQDLQ